MKVRVNWELFNADLKRYGVTAQDLSVALGKNANYISNMRYKKDELVSENLVNEIEKAMFKPKGTYCVCGDAPATEDLDLSIVIKLLNEQLVELKAIRTDLASAKQELLSVQSAIRDKVAFTHTAVTSVRENIGEIKKQLG